MLSDLGQWIIAFPVPETTTSSATLIFVCTFVSTRLFLASCRFQGWLLSQKSLYVSWGGVGGDAALLCPKQRGLKKDNVSRFPWEKVICSVLPADSEERDAQNSRNLPLMMLFN